jgi:hypothetical protein
VPAGRISPSFDGPPDIMSEGNPKDGFGLVLYVGHATKEPDGSQVLKAEGLYKDEAVGFEVVLSGWKGSASSSRSPLKMSIGMVTLRSCGEISDAFVKALDQLYQTSLSPDAMVSVRDFEAVSLQGDPQDLMAGRVSFKLTHMGDFETQSEGQAEADFGYAEFYINLELAGHRLEFSEKDFDYRASVVRALSKR